MNSILIVILVIIGIIFCCAYPYLLEIKYVEMYGGKGLSYLFAGMLGASAFLWYIKHRLVGNTQWQLSWLLYL